jgi:hypothetical protein
MAKLEFLRLTDSKSGEPIYLDPSQIGFIQQISACDKHERHTRVDVISSSQCFVVSEEAIQIALCSGRGFYGPSDKASDSAAPTP